MKTLEIPIISITNHGLSLDVVVSANSLKPEDIAPIPLDEIHVVGTLTPLIDQYLFQGTVSGTFVQTCDRCLGDAKIPVESEVTWTFEEGPEKDYLQQLVDEAEIRDDDAEEAVGIFTFQGVIIDLSKPVWDEINLATPSKYICSDTCDGLCPVCGGNRNITPCNCEDDIEDVSPTTDSGFAGLKDLFPDLPES